MLTQCAGTKAHWQAAGPMLNSTTKYLTMKPIQFKIQAPTQRRHRALFDQDLPFRGRVEQPKTVYQRQPKHRKQESL